ncbi:DMT family transporter [Streptomyces caatingaensis]|uniref:DMT family transporter n=1 Tax=Streptomyces caatingaensis TaxID=1678637 RepID=UPI00069F7640|nr:DMT family transporter [Streptomyces caatingaensis]
MSAPALPVLLCLVSALCYAAAAIVQEKVAASAPGAGGLRGPLRSAPWWCAVALTGLGAGLHVLALAGGPLSLVQPMGALTIVFALPMAALLTRRPVGAAGRRGALLATAGLAGLLALTGPPRTEFLPAGQRPVLAGAVLAAGALLTLAARRARRPVVRGVALAGAAGAAFGMASVLTKAAAEDVLRGRTAALVPTLAVVAVLASAGMLLSQASYRGAGLAAPLATVTVVNPVVAAAVGVAALGEGFRYGAAGGVLAGAAGIVAGTGVVLLTLRGASAAEEPPAAAAGSVPRARAAVAAAPPDGGRGRARCPLGRARGRAGAEPLPERTHRGARGHIASPWGGGARQR